MALYAQDTTSFRADYNREEDTRALVSAPLYKRTAPRQGGWRNEWGRGALSEEPRDLGSHYQLGLCVSPHGGQIPLALEAQYVYLDPVFTSDLKRILSGVSKPFISRTGQ